MFSTTTEEQAEPSWAQALRAWLDSAGLKLLTADEKKLKQAEPSWAQALRAWLDSAGLQLLTADEKKLKFRLC